MAGIPQAQIGAHAFGNRATIGQAKRAGSVCRGALQGFKRGHAEQRAGHVHGQGQAGHRAGSGVAIGGHGHRHACGAQGGDGRHPGFAQGVKRAGQDHSNAARGSHRGDALRAQIFQMIGRQGAELCSHCRAAKIRQLFGMQLNRQAQSLRGLKQALHLGRRKRNAFAKRIHRVDQAFRIRCVQRRDCHLVNIGIRAVAIFGRNRMGGQMRGDHPHRAQPRNPACRAQHRQFCRNRQAIARFHFDRCGSGGNHLIDSGKGLRQQIGFRCRARCNNG